MLVVIPRSDNAGNGIKTGAKRFGTLNNDIFIVFIFGQSVSISKTTINLKSHIMSATVNFSLSILAVNFSASFFQTVFMVYWYRNQSSPGKKPLVQSLEETNFNLPSSNVRGETNSPELLPGVAPLVMPDLYFLLSELQSALVLFVLSIIKNYFATICCCEK